MRKVYGGRALLNEVGHFSTAAMVAEIEDTSTWEEGKNGEGLDITNRWRAAGNVTLQIANCDRSISFEIDFDDEESYENSLAKVDTMLELLKDFRRGMVVEKRRFDKRLKLVEQAAEKEKLQLEES